MSRVPVYEQIINQLEKFIISGILSEGDQLPSVRSLSFELGINPNTILKAYNDLDYRKIVFSVPGKGYFVKDSARKELILLERKKIEEFLKIAGELADAGISKEELTAELNKLFDSKEKNKNDSGDKSDKEI